MRKASENTGAKAIRALVRAGKYEFSLHAEQERQADKITTDSALREVVRQLSAPKEAVRP